MAEFPDRRFRIHHSARLIFKCQKSGLGLLAAFIDIIGNAVELDPRFSGFLIGQDMLLAHISNNLPGNLLLTGGLDFLQFGFCFFGNRLLFGIISQYFLKTLGRLFSLAFFQMAQAELITCPGQEPLIVCPTVSDLAVDLNCPVQIALRSFGIETLLKQRGRRFCLGPGDGNNPGQQQASYDNFCKRSPNLGGTI